MKLWISVPLALALVCGVAAASEDPSPQHVKWMKDLGDQSGNIRKGIDVEANAKAMQASVKAMESFWKARNSAVANQAMADNLKGAQALEAAAAKGDKDAMAAAQKQIGGSCRGCHEEHREKLSDTQYRIR